MVSSHDMVFVLQRLLMMASRLSMVSAPRGLVETEFGSKAATLVFRFAILLYTLQSSRYFLVTGVARVHV